MMALAGVSLLSLLGFGFLIATGLLWVARIPGLHFDEAWAANFAYRILTEHGFWPLSAMSPYTHPWAHYVTALFFHLFGTSVFVYRAAGVSMNVAGALLAWVALMRWGERRAAALFPFLLAFFVPFVLNERFTIEITSFLILCLGLLILGAQLRSSIVVFVAAFFGVTSHLLFLAPVLALLSVWGLQSGRWRFSHRMLVLMTALSLAPFLWSVYREIPEKDKASVLLLADAAVIVFVVVFGQMPRAIRRMRETLKWIVGIASIPFMFYLMFFSEGHWSILFTHGMIARHWILVFSVPLTLLGLASLCRMYWRSDWSPPEQRFWSWMLYTVFFLGILAVKPTPRYFDIAFFLMAMGASVLLGRLPWRRSAVFLGLFVGMSGLVLCGNYFLPGLRGRGVDRSYRFLFFHDSSGDPLPKQDLVRFLGQEGCAYSQVGTPDPRMAEALLFLSHGDWPVRTGARCPASHLLVERVAEEAPFWPGGGSIKAGKVGKAGSEVFGAFRMTWQN